QESIEHALDIRYVGQEYTLTIPLLSAAEPNQPDFDEVLPRRFDEAHERRFGHANPGAPIELVALRTTALGDLGRAHPQPIQRRTENGYAFAQRPVVFGRQPRATRVVRRDVLAAGAIVDGPAILVEETATTVVPPQWRLRVDTYGDLIMSADGEGV
ncbi:MAG: hypothetical protein WAL22_21560, partial [Solirubrobacteraceae bacterium]